MTGIKTHTIQRQSLTLALLGLTLAVIIIVPRIPVEPPPTAPLVFKTIASPSVVENRVASDGRAPTHAKHAQPALPPRAKWQTPPALLPDMVPFRGKKGDEAYDQYIFSAAACYDMDPAVIKAVIMAESGFNPRAVSRAGARGLMQLMPRTASALGVEDALDPRANIMGGTKYLKKLLCRFDNDIELALAAYNAGSRNVRKHNGIPPFKATHRYIAKIKVYYQHYRDTRFDILS